MTSSIISFSLFLFYTSFFSIKVIFERIITLSVKIYSPECFICYISCISIVKECLLCFSNKSNTVLTLLVICFSIYFTFGVWEFVSETRPRHDFFSNSFINKGSFVRSNISFFKSACFLRATFFFIFQQFFQLEPNLKKMYFGDHW